MIHTLNKMAYQYPIIPKVLGPAFLQLGTDHESIPVSLNNVGETGLPKELGIIAGTSSYEPWFSQWLAGDDDGKVAVSSAKHPAMKSFISLDANHTTIMKDPRVLKHILSFLESGEFHS